MENGQIMAAAPSNSSDRSDRSDKPLDQKVISLVLFSSSSYLTMNYLLIAFVIFHIIDVATACPES